MPDIDNPQVVRFCNEQVRVLADLLASAYYTAKAVRDWYDAHPEIGAELTANMSGAVVDGSAADGRSIITGNDVLGLIARAGELVNDYDADGGAKRNTVLRVEVNGQSRV